MDSEEVAGEGSGGGGDSGDRLKQRWGDKVYTRRSKRAKTITNENGGVVVPNSGQQLDLVLVDKDREAPGKDDASGKFEKNCVQSGDPESHGVEIPGSSALALRDAEEALGLAKVVFKDRIRLLSNSKQENIGFLTKFENDLQNVRQTMRKVGIESATPLPAPAVDIRRDIAGQLQERSNVGSVAPPSAVFAHRLSGMRPVNQLQLSVAVMDNNNSFAMPEMNDKRTPKANSFYRNPDFIVANDKIPQAEANKKSRSQKKKGHGKVLEFRVGSKTYKSCCVLLERLFKHKSSYIFDKPVDVEGLCLHDYFNIIKQPMDLGTVKARLKSRYYKVPREFAEDVRLIFHNAMTYNPVGHVVHSMAQEMLKIFEDRWAGIEKEYLKALKHVYNYDMHTPTSARSTPLAPSLLSPFGGRALSRSQSMMNPVDHRLEAKTLTPSGGARAPKKPKAKDLNKRDMTFAEKQKLSSRLQSLPVDKLDGVIQIIKRRNSAHSQHGNEIEVDIDTFDTETLWELDRFIINHKKSVSKSKRRNELAAQAGMEANNKMQHMNAAVPAGVEAAGGTAVGGVIVETRTDDKIASSSNATPLPSGPNNSKSSSSSSSSSDSGSSSSSDSESDSSSNGSDSGGARHSQPS